MEFISSIGNTTIPLSMIIVGIQLGDCRFKELFANKELIKTSFVSLILIPAISLAVLWFIPIANIIKMTITLTFIYPTAILPVAQASTEKKNAKLMAEAVAMTTLLSMFTIPIWIVILNNLF